LSQLLQAVADSGINVLSIHQTIPLQGRANVTLSISTSAMEENIHTLMNKLRKFDFIEKVEILGSGA
ncbi:ACT domain-containing protein, partial [Bacillus velezensis]